MSFTFNTSANKQPPTSFTTNFGVPPTNSFQSNPLLSSTSNFLGSTTATPSQNSQFSFGNAPFTTQQPSGFIGSNISTPLNQFTQNALPHTMATPAQSATGIPYPKDTRFLDLPIEIRNSIEALDARIKQHADQSATLSSRSSYDGIQYLSTNIAEFEQKIRAFEILHEQSISRIYAAKRSMHQYWKYGENVARSLSSSKKVDPNTNVVTWIPIFAPQDISFFEEIVRKLETRLNELGQLAETIRRILDSLQASGRFAPESLKNTLRSQHDIFLGLASRYAMVHYEIERLRSEYRAFAFKCRQDFRDPFAPKHTNSTSTKDAYLKPQVAIEPPTAPLGLNSNVPAVPLFNAPATSHPQSSTALTNNRSFFFQPPKPQEQQFFANNPFATPTPKTASLAPSLLSTPFATSQQTPVNPFQPRRF